MELAATFFFVIIALCLIFVFILGIIGFFEGPNAYTNNFQYGICYALKGKEILAANNSYTCINGQEIIFKKTLTDAYKERKEFSKHLEN